jgi:hypothetical protein
MKELAQAAADSRGGPDSLSDAAFSPHRETANLKFGREHF